MESWARRGCFLLPFFRPCACSVAVREEMLRGKWRLVRCRQSLPKAGRDHSTQLSRMGEKLGQAPYTSQTLPGLAPQSRADPRPCPPQPFWLG